MRNAFALNWPSPDILAGFSEAGRCSHLSQLQLDLQLLLDRDMSTSSDSTRSFTPYHRVVLLSPCYQSLGVGGRLVYDGQPHALIF